MSIEYRSRAEEQMRKHPEAMMVFEQMASLALRKNKVVPFGLLVERIRWEMTIERSDEVFKLNNNYRPYIARELMDCHPHLQGRIVIRETKD